MADYAEMDDIDFGLIQSEDPEEINNPSDDPTSTPDDETNTSNTSPDTTSDPNSQEDDTQNQGDNTDEQDGTSNTDTNGNDEDNTGGDTQDDETKLTGIEQYLSQFDIEGGMINTKDGGARHFDDLTPDQQAVVLNTLHEKSSAPNNGLAQQDAYVLQQAQANGMDLPTFIQAQVQSQTQQILELQSMQNLDVESMTDEQVFKSMLMGGSDKEIAPEDLEQQLADAKALPTFERQVQVMRNQLINDRDALKAQEEAADYAEYQQSVQRYQQSVIDSVAPIDVMFDVAINDNIKNQTLDRVLAYDENGDAPFLKEILSDPRKLFRAAFLYDNAEGLLEGRDRYWKEKNSLARKNWQKTQPTSQNNKQSFIDNTNTNQVSSNEVEDDDDDYDMLSDDIFFAAD